MRFTHGNDSRDFFRDDLRGFQFKITDFKATFQSHTLANTAFGVGKGEFTGGRWLNWVQAIDTEVSKTLQHRVHVAVAVYPD